MKKSPQGGRKDHQKRHQTSGQSSKLSNKTISDSWSETPLPFQPDAQPQIVQTQNTQPKNAQPQVTQPTKNEGNFLHRFAAKHPDIASVFRKFAFFFILFTVFSLVFGWDSWTAMVKYFWSVPATSIILQLIIDWWSGLKSGTENTVRAGLGREARHDETWVESTDRFLNVLMSLAKIRLVRAIVVLSIIIAVSSLGAHAFCEGIDIHFPGIRYWIEGAEPQPVPKQDKSDNDTSDGDAPGAATDFPSKPELPLEEDIKLLPKEDQGSEPFLLDPERSYTLSIKEANDLFFLSGSYTLTDWLSPAMIREDELSAESVTYNKIAVGNSPIEIANIVKPFLEDLCNQRVPNLFDGIAPQSICNDIADASSLQEKMINSADLDRIIMTRSEVWSGYPKFGIANLLANNMQRYAQEYHKISGAYETKKYYQAQAIFWSFKSLVFSSVDPATRKTTLSYISMRYHDIADMAAFGSEEQVRASALSEAFKLLENMEFSFDPASDSEQESNQIIPAEDEVQIPQE